jgi:D-lactate dehydrogenase (cytochrome)
MNASSETAVATLRGWLGRRLVTDADDLAKHGEDTSMFPAAPPQAVCYPTSTDDVVNLVDMCREVQLPIIPWGVGTSVEGAVLATRGGVTLDLSRMNQILAIRPDDLDCTVQAGVTRVQLNDALRQHGLFFPIDPGANATIGGMVATRASGTNAVRYGTMRDNVLALTVVLPSGEVIKTGSRARKSAAGYDLTRLFTGSEGTLGVITEVTLRLYPIPEAISSAVVTFPEVDHAVQAVTRVIQAGIPVARVELLDGVMMDAINRYSGLHQPVQPTLFLEFHGTVAGVQEQAQRAGYIMRGLGGGDFAWATDEAERQRLWQARHNAYYAALALRPGCKSLTTDVCVPLSRLAECIRETQADLAETGLLAPIVGHVGDGNFHLIVLLDPDNAGEMAEVQRVNERLIKRALAMDGTCTGEHGVGIGKAKYMRLEHGAALDLMRDIKVALDPLNLMNPGKVLPDGG